jgi:hypothetical protein
MSVYSEAECEAARFKWIESEKAGADLGEGAIRAWVRKHWWGFLRARWMQHLRGERFWVELDRGDFGLLKRAFQSDDLLLDRILDRLEAGQENLDVICWAHAWGIPIDPVLRILEGLDVNSRRIFHRFDNPDAIDVPVVRIDPAWLAWEGGTVVRLARGIELDGDLAALPILGDALEDAGCADPAVLDHCRNGTDGDSRSWLVDLILWGP